MSSGKTRKHKDTDSLEHAFLTLPAALNSYMCIYEMRASWASATEWACVCMHSSPASDARKSYQSGNQLALVQPYSQVSEESRLLRLCVIEPWPAQKAQHSGHSDTSCRVKLGLAKILAGPYDPASPTGSSESVYMNYEPITSNLLDP